MLAKTLTTLFTRDLEKLKNEINQYPDEASLWKKSGTISNSGGNLCMHLIGNLKHYIGVGLSHTDYVRDRAFEFEGKDISKAQLVHQIDEAISVVQKSLAELSDKDIIEGTFPIQIWEEKTPMDFTLMHLHAHLNYHLGQINYHRRMV